MSQSKIIIDSLIPELANIVLDYYYSMIHKENTINLISEYHKRCKWDTCWDCLDDKYTSRAYNYRNMKLLNNYKIYNNTSFVSILPRNYM